MMSLDDFLDEGPRPDTTPPVPAIAAKAEDLEAFRKSVEDSAGVSGGLWLSYLFVWFYLAVAAGAVTHTDLLLQNPVKLPFLNIELPLLAFFFLAPILFVITHAYTLVNLALLADRVRQFHKELGDQLAANPALQASKIRSAHTRQLPGNIFVQFLGGPDEIRNRALGKALAGILWLTLVVAPVALLLLLQLQFLPYHSRLVTWTNRIALVLDLVLIWWLWGKILRRRANYSKARSWWLRRLLPTSTAILAILCVFLFACAVATIPGEGQANHPYLAALKPLRGWIFGGFVDDDDRRTNLFTNRIVLSGFNIYEALKIDDPKKVEWKQRLIDLRGRDLKGAYLFRAILPRADLTAAQLQGANLWGAQLQGASLKYAELQGASLVTAQLQGASLEGAQLQGALLVSAQLQGAYLKNARLQGAWLDGAQLQGALLDFALLPGASLEGAQLQGAWLTSAKLQGANLSGQRLLGANLDGAFLWRAQLQGAVPENILNREIHWGPENIFYPNGEIHWDPFQGSPPAPLWTPDAAYAALREFIEHEVPEGQRRNEALHRVSVLDCTKTGNTLASCDPSAATPDIVEQWKRKIEAANVDWSSYRNAVAAIFGDLVCSDAPDRIYVLRGLLRREQIALERTGLLKRVTSTECPVSAALTDADKRVIADREKRTKSP
jgi:uncharacterized protein YjbI with pentapeptide repeats